eukprot:Em0001g1596a
MEMQLPSQQSDQSIMTQSEKDKGKNSKECNYDELKRIRIAVEGILEHLITNSQTNKGIGGPILAYSGPHLPHQGSPAPPVPKQILPEVQPAAPSGANHSPEYFLTESGVNLLNLRGADINKYALNLMDALYTEDELKTSSFVPEINRQLREASKVGNIEVVVELLQRGVRVNGTDAVSLIIPMSGYYLHPMSWYYLHPMSWYYLHPMSWYYLHPMSWYYPIPCHGAISIPCHGAISIPCHGTISTPCHGTISIPCHGTISTPCHGTISTPCHGTIHPMSWYYLHPMSWYYLHPMSWYYLHPMSWYYLHPMSWYYLHPMSLCYLHPMSWCYLHPMSWYYLHPMSWYYLHPMSWYYPSHVMVLSPSYVMVLFPYHVMVLSPSHVMMSHVMVLSPSHVMVLSPSHVMVLSPSHDMVLAPSHVMVLSPSHVMDRWSSLMWACVFGNAEVVKILVSAGAHVNDQSKDGTSSLKLACEKGHAEVVKILVSAGAHVNDQRKDGTSSLNLACKNGNADVVKILVSAGAHVNHQDVIVVRLPIWSVLDRLMNKWMPSPDQLMSGLVGVRAALSIRRSCFQGVWLQPLLHVTQHFQSQWQSCRLVVNGPLEALETWMASLSIGFLEAGLLYTRERCRDWDQLEGVAETLVASGTSGLDGCGRWGQGSGLDNGGSCCKGSGCVSLTSGFKNSALIVIRVPGMAICASSSHDGKQFLPLYGMEWEALLWLPVTLEPSPIVVHVGPKSWGASGISEELKRVSCCPFWVQEHGDTIPRRKKAVPPPNVCCCLGIKAHMMVELSDCGGEIDQTAEEDSAGTTLAAACPWGGAGAVAQRLIGIDANLVNRRGLTPLKLARGYEVLTMLRKYTTSCEDFPVHTYGKVIMCGDSGAGKSTLTEVRHT